MRALLVYFLNPQTVSEYKAQAAKAELEEFLANRIL